MMNEELAMTIQQKQQEICNLTSELQASASPIGDWKIAKYQEYILAGKPAPYDINELYTKRQAIRDRINELRVEIEALTAQGE